ncbi:MAG: hypothetical protein SFU98_16170 [Leptospiraceae bacterium]|nr:hypothetical protein [Leptospiraceae bacterium]
MKKFLLFFILLSYGVFAENITLTIHKNELRVDGKFILFEEDSGVKRASYNVYRFPKKNFEKVAGKLSTLPDTFDLEVKVLNSKTETNDANASLSQPEGGIKTNNIFVRAMKKLDLPTKKKD